MHIGVDVSGIIHLRLPTDWPQAARIYGRICWNFSFFQRLLYSRDVTTATTAHFHRPDLSFRPVCSADCKNGNLPPPNGKNAGPVAFIIETAHDAYRGKEGRKKINSRLFNLLKIVLGVNPRELLWGSDRLTIDSSEHAHETHKNVDGLVASRASL
jgi:hypothetical protein